MLLLLDENEYAFLEQQAALLTSVRPAGHEPATVSTVAVAILAAYRARRTT